MKRPKITREEITKTRKRLEEVRGEREREGERRREREGERERERERGERREKGVIYMYI